MFSPPSRRPIAPALFTLTLLLLSACTDQNAMTAAGLNPPTGDASAQALTQDEVCLDGDPACTPTGAHAKHGAFACGVCHKVAGRLVFDKSGPAYSTVVGSPAPTFNATGKTCSNVACHSVTGTYNYEVYDWGSDSYVPVQFTYGGSGSPLPNWYATGSNTCGSCHGMPPTYAVWHSGLHGTTSLYPTTNACQTCHPDASGLLVYNPQTGLTVQNLMLTNPSLHGNGTLDVTARFTTACFGCH